MLFNKRSLNVKLVKDKDAVSEPSDPMDNIRVVQAYADIAVDATMDIAKAIATVVVVKAGCDVAKIAAKAIFH